VEYEDLTPQMTSQGFSDNIGDEKNRDCFMKREKVAVAMSGGVDSSVAALLLKGKGYNVIGMTMEHYPLPESILAGEEAARVAQILRIPHHVVKLEKEFKKYVVDDFCQEYEGGRTPNPCIRCNKSLKFGLLLEKANKLGAKYIATGHHARVFHDSLTKRFLLKKGKDRQKDQSYFLYSLSQDQLSFIKFPVGELTKDEVREKARKFDLPAAKRPESQEICFIPDNDYVGFLKDRTPHIFRPGPIIDKDGRILGRHEGIAHFTIGQRRGMGIAAPKPLYVIEIQAEKNTIIAGPEEELYKKELQASSLNMISLPELRGNLEVEAKIRYKYKPAKAIIKPLSSNKALVKFSRPQRAVTPGQAVVFYDGDVLIGGGTID